MSGALLALLLSQDAGLPRAVYAERGQYLLWGGNWEESECFPVADGGTSCAGAWVPEPRLMSNARELAALRAENVELRKAPPAVSWVTVLGFGLGLLAGAAGVGYLWWSFGR